MNFLNPFFRRNAPNPAHSGGVTKALPLPYRRFALADWCNSPERVAYVGELLKQPLFLDLLGMLSNVRVGARGSLDATTAAFLLGQRAGQDLVIASILQAGTPVPAMPEDIPADYAAENVMAAWEKEGDMQE